MFYLALAILSSAMVSIAMRCGEGKIKNNMEMFTTNYLVCAILSVLFMRCSMMYYEGSIFDKSMIFALILGGIQGLLYLGNFALLQYNIRKNGVVMSATFMKLGVLIPTIMAIVIFHEQPRVVQLLGVLLAVISIIMIHFEKEGQGNPTVKILLLILLLCSGITDSLANIYDKMGDGALKDHFLLCTFLVAGICALLLWMKEGEEHGWWNVFFGICVGIPNYFSARFLLLALHKIPAVIVYPVYSIATLVVISLAGVLFFKEKLSPKKMIAMGMIFMAFILLNQ